MGFAKHLFYTSSPVDASAQPYVASIPEHWSPNEPLPVVVYLHDTLDDPTSSGFIDEAFRQAHRWTPALEQNEPCCFVQPFCRGNAGVIGWGAIELQQMLEELPERLNFQPQRVVLLGVGMGGTAVLQLACLYPDCFAAVAAIGAWTDPRLCQPIGIERPPAWQRSQLRQLSPIALAENLRNLPVYLEHPWWVLGGKSSVTAEHSQKLFEKLARSNNVTLADADSGLRREIPSAPRELLGWLLEKTPCCPSSVNFRTYSNLVNQCHYLKVDALQRPGKAAKLRADFADHVLTVRTKRVAAFTIQTNRLPGQLESLSVDGEEIPLSDVPKSICLERFSDSWNVTTEPPLEDGAAPLTGLHLRFGRTAFVFGTLGDEQCNLACRQTAERLAWAWQSGTDSANRFPGDRRAAIDCPVIADVEVTEADLASQNLVLVGGPNANLLTARFQHDLPVDWSTDDEVSFQFRGVEYCRPDEALAMLVANPEFPQRSLLVFSANSPIMYDYLGRLETALLPSYLVIRGSKVLDWGYMSAR